MSPSGHTVGFDIGGTNIRAIRLDGAGRVVGSQRSCRRPAGSSQLVDAVSNLVDELSEADTAVLDAVGIGVAGLVDRSGVVRVSPNISSLVEFPLGAEVAARVGLPVVVENDANVAAWAEFNAHGAGLEHLLLVAAGTGIGGGVVANGQLVRGWQGFASEIGHMTLLPGGPRCGCGRDGCWEALASGSALGRLARAAAAEGRFAAALDEVGGDPAGVSGEHVTALAAAGDADAGELLDEWSGWLGMGIANLVAVLDPEVVVLGGGLSESGTPVIERVRAAVGRHLFGAGHRRPPQLELSVHGDSAGVLGAALLARVRP